MKKSIFLFALVAATACTTEQPAEKESPVVESVKQESAPVEPEKQYNIPEDGKYNDLATYLAGIEGGESSSLKSLEENPVWGEYKTKLDEIWTKTNAKLPVMKEWAGQEMKDANEAGGTLFYPFSGPDFLHADLFFPEYENVVMIGLEPIGSYPDMLQKNKEEKTEEYLNGVRKSLHAILGLSFFRTIAMADDFNGEVDGTLPIIFQFLNRTGNEVLYQEKVAVMANGMLETDMSKATDSTYIGNRYYFKRNGEEKMKTLTYFAVNLQNSPYVSRGGLVAKGLETRTDFVAYLESLNINATYLKSASYLMHRPTFSIIRNVVLSSDYVLQDDSGIPVQFFPTSEWELTFYGNYEKPISLFSERHQEDLMEIYKGEGIKNLPFGIGYQYRKGTSNLMKAKRKK